MPSSPALVRQLGAAARMLLLLTVITGVAYPLAVLGVGQTVAHGSAGGSLVSHRGTVVASTSLGQAVPASDSARWFLGRPSVSDYAGSSSGGSNLAANSEGERKALRDNATTVRTSNPSAGSVLPPDALTASASGLDPDISPDYALLQVARVAKARGLSEGQVRALVEAHVKGRLLGFLGEPRVNTVELNLALADLPASS